MPHRPMDYGCYNDPDRLASTYSVADLGYFV